MIKYLNLITEFVNSKKRVALFYVIVFLFSLNLIPNKGNAQTLMGLDRLNFWLTASQGVTLGIDSNVLSWENLVDLSDSSLQSTVLKQPVLITQDSTLNNQPVIFFDGTDDELMNLNGHDFGALYVIAKWNGPETVFPTFNGMIARLSVSSTSTRYLFIGQNASTNLFTTTPWGSGGTSVNNQPSISLAPFNEYKLIYGETSTPVSLNDLLIG